MSKVKVKVVATVEINEPKSTLEKQSTTERNESIRNAAEEILMDTLTLGGLSPEIIRVRLSKGDK
jgi:hypothetical protein